MNQAEAGAGGAFLSQTEMVGALLEGTPPLAELTIPNDAIIASCETSAQLLAIRTRLLTPFKQDQCLFLWSDLQLAYMEVVGLGVFDEVKGGWLTPSKEFWARWGDDAKSSTCSVNQWMVTGPVEDSGLWLELRFPDDLELGCFRIELARKLEVWLRAIWRHLLRSPADQSRGKGKKQPRSERRYLWLAEAMLAVKEHPDWPDARIAELVRVDKSTLSRCREYKVAAAEARKDDTRRGMVKRTSGPLGRDVVAFDDDVNVNRRPARQSDVEEDLDDRIDREMKEKSGQVGRNATRNATHRRR